LAIIWRYWGLSEPEWIGRRARVLEPIGDASYSLYLVHGFVLTIIFRIWIMVIGTPSVWLMPVCLVGAIVVGWLTYVAIERPLLSLFDNKHKTSPTRTVA